MSSPSVPCSTRTTVSNVVMAVLGHTNYRGGGDHSVKPTIVQP